jgi:hypothetical protein
MKRLLPVLLVLLVAFTFTACERLTIPVISNASVTLADIAVVNAKAVMKAREIDECGLFYSSSNSKPTLADNDAVVYGDLESDGTFATTLTLKANTTYWFVFFATNELGTATSETIKLQTGQFYPDANDNPLPNP